MERDKLFMLVYGIIGIFVSLIIISIQYAPVFTLFILMICTTVILYVLTEHWKTHDAVEFENRFWSLMAGILAWSCVFCSDSPFVFSEEKSGWAWFVVFVSAYSVHVYDRHLRRKVLRRVPRIPRNSSSQFDLSTQNNAKSLLSELRGYQERLDNKYISSFFQNIFNIGRVLHLEHQIIQIFAKAERDELNILLTTAQLGLLFYKIKDHRFVRHFNRTKFLKLLCVDRVEDLSVIAKVMLIDGLQKMKLSAHASSDHYVKNVVLNTEGDELSEMKSLCDCKGDVNSFHKLIYRDLTDEEDRKEILAHIAAEARMQRADRGRNSFSGKYRGKLAWRKVISDVDDTLTCSGGTWPAGMDNSYPRKVIYPGVLAFYRELDLGFHVDSWDRRKHVGNLAFLSARPHVYKDVSEVQSYLKFRDLQEKRDLYTSPTLLAGSLEAGRQFMVRGNIEPVAVKKYANLKEYLAIYPEYNCMYIGDNGQGDVRAAEMMFDEVDEDSDPSERCGEIERAYIHQVQPVHNTHTFHERSRTIGACDDKFFYFNTYVDAAIDAYAHKYIGLGGLKSIMEEALADFHFITPEQWKAAEESSLSVKVNKMSRTITRSTVPKPVTSSVVTGATDTIDDKGSETGSESSSQMTGGSRQLGAGIHSSRQIHHQTTIVQVFNPELKVDARIREMNASMAKANLILIDEGLSPVELLRFRQRFSVGSVVRTLYGLGVVVRFRNMDGLYEIIVQWDASGMAAPTKMYLQGSSIKPVPLTLNPSMTVRRFRSSASSVQVSIPSAVRKVELSWDAATDASGEKMIRGGSALNSVRSSPATTNSTSNTVESGSTGVGTGGNTVSLTLAAVARHNIISGLKPGGGGDGVIVSGEGVGTTTVKGDDSSISSTTSTVNRLVSPADVPLEKALEMAFLPNALSRTTKSFSGGPPVTKASGGNGGSMVLTSTTTRARTLSETSDDMLSSNLGEVIGRYRTLHPNDRLSTIRGAQVWCAYGIGSVEDYREKDDMMVVRLSHWSATVYLPRASVVQLTDPRHTVSFQFKILKELDALDSWKANEGESVVLGDVFVDGGIKDKEQPPKISDVGGEKGGGGGSGGGSKDESARKPSIFPGWLPSFGWGSSGNKTDESTVDNQQDNFGVSRVDVSGESGAKLLVGSEVMTVMGLGTIHAIFKDEYDDKDMNVFSTFIVEVSSVSQPGVTLFLSPQSIRTTKAPVVDGCDEVVSCDDSLVHTKKQTSLESIDEAEQEHDMELEGGDAMVDIKDFAYTLAESFEFFIRDRGRERERV
jgi:hypothetical protein